MGNSIERLQSELESARARLAAARDVLPGERMDAVSAEITFYAGVVYGLMTAIEIVQRECK